ncbi:MAG TPA: AMP-binding protein, partial [Planctomycetota bacterium]|nr:AMP-binding protein [Planctomycetota bacterium]
ALAARCRGLGVPCGLLLEIETLLAAPDPGEVAPPAWLAGHHLAYVIYTSGTTGAPKGVMIEHRSIANLVASDLVAFAPGPEDRVLQGSSLAYDSSLEEVWLALASGGCVVVADDETVRRGPDLLPWLRAERISVLCPTPTLLRALGCREPQRELPQLRLVYAGGEALPRDLAELWSQGRHFENGYGPTECTVTVVRGPVHRGEEVSIGRPVRGHRALILDQALAEVPEGEVGELHIAGIGLARGYLGRAEATAERFVQHPRHGRIYRTGDLARRTSDGRIFCLGRADAQVKLRGHRLELEAIEAAIAECPGVRTAACRIAGQEPQQVLEALVIASNGTLPDAAGLRATLRQNLPAPMVPGRIAFVPALPTAVSGKLDRRALSALAVAFPPLARSGGAPQNELEQRVHAAFTAVLRGSDIGRDDDFFFDLGGDSLRAAEIVSQLRRDPRTSSIAVRDLYEARTVAAVAARAASTPAGPAAAPLPMAPMFGISHPIATACVQAVWLLLGVGAGALAGFALLFLVVPWLGNLLGWNGLLALLPLLLFAGTLLWCAGTVLLTVTAKWLLLGRYRALRVRVASSYYLRHWLVQHCASLVPWGLLQGTALCSTALRVLGARVGKRLHVHRGVDLSLGGWDLLQLGDDVSLGQDAMLELVSLDAGYLVVGPVALGDGATLETRAGVAAHAQLEPGACL